MENASGKRRMGPALQKGWERFLQCPRSFITSQVCLPSRPFLAVRPLSHPNHGLDAHPSSPKSYQLDVSPPPNPNLPLLPRTASSKASLIDSTSRCLVVHVLSSILKFPHDFPFCTSQETALVYCLFGATYATANLCKVPSPSPPRPRHTRAVCSVRVAMARGGARPRHSRHSAGRQRQRGGRRGAQTRRQAWKAQVPVQAEGLVHDHVGENGAGAFDAPVC